MVFSRSQIVARANASLTYPSRMCMQWTRTMAGIDAIGDFDGDKAADAEDGWKATPSKHPGDRKPPAGTFVWYGGGSSDNGHAAISLGPDRDGRYLIRTTDGDGAGRNGTRFLDYPEKSWGMPYLGWTDGIGNLIPENDLEPTRPSNPPAPKVVELEVLSWNVYIGNDADDVIREVRDLLAFEKPHVMFLYESLKLYGRLDGLAGYRAFQLKPKAQLPGATSNNGNVVVLVKDGLKIHKNMVMRMTEKWFGPKSGHLQDPRVYRWIKVEKGGVIWKIGGFHFPFGKKPRRESVLRTRAWVENTRKGRPVIGVGDWQRGKADIEANIANPVGAKVAGQGIDLVIYKHCGLVSSKSLGERISDHPVMRFRFRKATRRS